MAINVKTLVKSPSTVIAPTVELIVISLREFCSVDVVVFSVILYNTMIK